MQFINPTAAMKFSIKNTSGFTCITRAKAVLQITQGDGKKKNESVTSSSSSSAKTRLLAVQRSEDRAGCRALQLLREKIYTSSPLKGSVDIDTVSATSTFFNTSVSNSAPTIIQYTNDSNVTYTGIIFTSNNSITFNTQITNASILVIGFGGDATYSNCTNGMGAASGILVNSYTIPANTPYDINIVPGNTNGCQISQHYNQTQFARAYSANERTGEPTSLCQFTQNGQPVGATHFQSGNGGTPPNDGASTVPPGLSVPFLPPINGSSYNFYVGGAGGGTYVDSNGLVTQGAAGAGFGGKGGYNNTSNKSNVAKFGCNPYDFSGYGAGAGGADQTPCDYPTSAPGCVIIWYHGTA